MTKIYLIVSLALLAAVLFGATIFADGGSKLVDVSWNSLPTLHWTADGTWKG